MFESRVVLDGSQTNKDQKFSGDTFESRVVFDGSQTVFPLLGLVARFESRVTLSENRINE